MLSQLILGFCGLLIVMLGPVPLSLIPLTCVATRKDHPSVAHSILLLLLSWCLIQTSMSILLGVAHQFTLHSVMACELSILTLGYVILRRIRRRMDPPRFRELFRIHRKLDESELILVLLCIAVALMLLWYVMGNPIEDSDSLAYHLPAMVHWYQTGSLAMRAEDIVYRYPFGWELISTLLFLPLHQDILVTLPNLLAWIMLGLSTFLIARRTGARRMPALIGMVLVLCVPQIVLMGVNNLQVDLAFAAIFMTCLCLLLLFHQTRRIHYLSLCLAASGLLLGMKTSALAYGPILLATLAVLEIRRVSAKKGILSQFFHDGDYTVAVGVFCSLMFLQIGGFWYVRNWIEVRNPLGFIKISLGAFDIFGGRIGPRDIAESTLAHLFDFSNPEHVKILLNELINRLGSPFVFMVLETLLLLFFILAGRGESKKRIGKAYATGILALIVITALMYWSTPFSADDLSRSMKTITPWIGQGFRYAFVLIALLGVAAALHLSTLSFVDTSVLMVLFVFLCVLQSTKNLNRCTIIPDVFVLVIIMRAVVGIHSLGMLRRAYPSWIRDARHVLTIAVVLGLSLIALSSGARRRDVRRSDNRFYGQAVDYIDENVEEGEKVGYVLFDRIYPLFGKKWDRCVVDVTPSSTNPTKWLRLLKRDDVEFVAVRILPWNQKRVAPAVSMLNAQQGRFSRVAGKDPKKEIVLYRMDMN